MKRGQKRAQVTIFVIVAILVIGAIAAIILVQTDIIDFVPDPIKKEQSEILSSIDSCIENSAIDAIYLIGLQGGYVESPSDFIETPYSDVSYGLKNKKNVLLSKERIEKEIKDYLEFALPFCYDALYYADAYGVEFKADEPNAQAEIFDDFVEVSSLMPINIKKGNTTYDIDAEFQSEIPIRLGKILKLANEIVEKQKQSKDQIPLTFLSELDAKIVFDYADNNTILYIINDKESAIEDISYSFLFAVDVEKSEVEG